MCISILRQRVTYQTILLSALYLSLRTLMSSYETEYVGDESRTYLVLRNLLFHFFIWTLILIVFWGVYLCIGLKQK